MQTWTVDESGHGARERDRSQDALLVAEERAGSAQLGLTGRAAEGTTVRPWRGTRSCEQADAAWSRHKAVIHSACEYVRRKVNINGMESFWSLFKRGYIGTFHRMSRVETAPLHRQVQGPAQRTWVGHHRPDGVDGAWWRREAPPLPRPHRASVRPQRNGHLNSDYQC